MSDQRREVTLSISTFVLACSIALSQCSISHDVDRLADTADAQMCIEGVRAGVGAEKLPSACSKIAANRP